jgi:hypothetical protein
MAAEPVRSAVGKHKQSSARNVDHNHRRRINWKIKSKKETEF